MCRNIYLWSHSHDALFQSMKSRDNLCGGYNAIMLVEGESMTTDRLHHATVSGADISSVLGSTPSICWYSTHSAVRVIL